MTAVSRREPGGMQKTAFLMKGRRTLVPYSPPSASSLGWKQLSKKVFNSRMQMFSPCESVCGLGHTFCSENYHRLSFECWYIHVYKSVCPSVRLSVCLSVCLSVFLWMQYLNITDMKLWLKWRLRSKMAVASFNNVVISTVLMGQNWTCWLVSMLLWSHQVFMSSPTWTTTIYTALFKCFSLLQS